MVFLMIPGKPIAKKRPRFARRGNFVKTYNDQETEEGRFLWEVRQQWQDEPMKGAVSIEMRFYTQRPKSHFRSNGQLSAKATGFPIGRPDVDNMVKFVLDCLNGCTWTDDAQVVTMVALKLFAKEGKPRTEIEIRTAEEYAI